MSLPGHPETMKSITAFAASRLRVGRLFEAEAQRNFFLTGRETAAGQKGKNHKSALER
jgi:hypothetical protein